LGIRGPKTKDLSAQSLTITSKVGFQTTFFISTLIKTKFLVSFRYPQINNQNANYVNVIRDVKSKKQNLERKRCSDGHENDDFDTTTASLLKLSFDSKGFGVKILRSLI